MPSSFNVRSAGGYERLMGRWSKRLAHPFIDFAGVADGDRILDVGCGNGSLTFALLRAADIREIVAVDYSAVFVEEVARINSDARVRVRQADATELPFDDETFDRSLALLVLHFVSDAKVAISEMRRVVKPGGVVAAAVWDHLGGMPAMRILLDTAATMDENARSLRERYCSQPMMAPEEMKSAFVAQGIENVEQASLLIRMDYQSFDDYWQPFSEGEGPFGKYIADLEPALRTTLNAAVREAYQVGKPDGPRSFVSVAWACRGTVPAKID